MISRSRIIDDRDFWIPSETQIKIVTLINELSIEEVADLFIMINEDILRKWNTKRELKTIKGSVIIFIDMKRKVDELAYNLNKAFVPVRKKDLNME